MIDNSTYFTELKKNRSNYFRDEEFRAFLDFVSPKWYIESESTGQGGDITKIIRNRFGIPVCLQVTCCDKKKDFISVDRVSFYEPWNNYIFNYDEYRDDAVFLGVDEE